jgi:polyferredoxin
MPTSRKFGSLIVAGVVFIALSVLPWIPTFTHPVPPSRDLGVAFDGVLAILFSGAMTLIGVALIVAAVFLRSASIGESSSEKPS